MMIIKSIALIMAYFLLTLPIAGATQVNIIFNGNVQQTAQLSPTSLVNKQLTVEHDPADITWSRVRVHTVINSASLAHSIERIYIFKCKRLDPTQCASVQPIQFDSFADTDLLWSDISEKEGASTYPQTGQLMTLVKLKNDAGQISWVGFFDRITRTDFNIFTKFASELPDIDFHVSSLDLVSPTASFITNTQMLPFAWASKVVFKASPLYAVGGDARDMDVPTLTAASPQGDTITSINKDFFLVSGKTSSGISDFVSMTKNPSFTCGDNKCDSNLGESSSVCCIDCGCSLGSYCDTKNPQSGEGVCKVESQISLRVNPPLIPPVTDCSQALTVTVSGQVINAPSSLPATVGAVMVLNNTPQRVSCTVTGDKLECPAQLPFKIGCGASSLLVSGNSLEVTLPFNDGVNQKTQTIASNFTSFPVEFQCGCPNGFFCDIGRFACMADSSLSLSVLEVTSFLSNFDPAGETVHMKVKVNNAPTDLAVTGVVYTLGSLFKSSTMIQNTTTGSITCTSEGPQVYGCDIPISIANYDHNAAYFFKGNKITFSVSYSNVDTAVSRDLTSAFADITIPAFSCGDGVCNVEETQSNCCTDCGCPASGMFCDVNRQACDDIGNINLQILSVDPVHLLDCTPAQSHEIHLTAQVSSPPSDLNLDFAFYLKGGVVQPYPLVCTKVNPGANAGLFDCTLTLPAFPECQSSPSDLILGPNSLNFTISFADGNKGLVTKTLQQSFSDVSITPTFQCGDNVCETVLGENGANCCIDCPCSEDPAFGKQFYCDASLTGDAGVCKDKSNIVLVIDNPTSAVNFDSCEKRQKIDIQAHLENMPKRVTANAFTAKLNGTNAEFLTCRFTTTIADTDSGTSAPISCSLTVPSIAKCSQGQTYTYQPNSLSVTLSFPSGQTTQIITSSAPLPSVTTTQQIRSIFDITRHAFDEMSREIDATVKLVDKMLNWIDTCIQVALMLVVVTLALVIVGGINGASDKNDKYTTTEGIKDGVQAGQGIMGMWTSICQLINTQYQAQLQAIQIRLQIKQSQFCVDIIQHQIDEGPDGPCGTGKEQSCFNQLVSCLNFQNIQSAMNEMGKYLDQTGKYANDIGNNIEKAADGLSDVFGNHSSTSTGVLQIGLNGLPLINGVEACNRIAEREYEPASTGVGPFVSYKERQQKPCSGGNADNLNIVVLKSQECAFPVVLVGSAGNQIRVESSVLNIDTYKDVSYLDFALYCFRSESEYVENLDRIDSFRVGGGPKPVKVTVDLNNDCDCSDNPISYPADAANKPNEGKEEGGSIPTKPSSSPGSGPSSGGSQLSLLVLGYPYGTTSGKDIHYAPSNTLYTYYDDEDGRTLSDCKLNLKDSDGTTGTISVESPTTTQTERVIRLSDVEDGAFSIYDDEGKHEIYLSCRDQSDREVKSDVDTITVDTTKPNPSISLSSINTDVVGTDLTLSLEPNENNVAVCFVDWMDDDLNVQPEVGESRTVTHHYRAESLDATLTYTCEDLAGNSPSQPATLHLKWNADGLQP